VAVVSFAPTKATTFVEALRERAESQPDAEAFTFLDHEGEEERRLDFAELDRRARAVASRLQALDLAGERALLACPPGTDCVAGLYGCLYAGVVATPCPAPDPGREYMAPRIRDIAADAKPRAVVTTTAMEPGIRDVLGESAGHVVAVDSDDAGDPGGWRDPGVRSDDLALLNYTSGTSAVPRGVIISHENLIANCDYVAQAFGYTSETHGAMWLPPYHDMGLVGGVLQPVYSGEHIALMSPLSFLRSPITWLRAIDRYRATLAGGPDFAFDMLVRRTRPEEREGLDLSRWEVAYNGAEMVRRETIDAFSEAFAPAGFRREAFYPCFGLAEATLMVTGSQKLAGPKVRRAERLALEAGRFEEAEDAGTPAVDLVGCGRPSPESRVLIVDPETRQRLEDGAIGEIWVSGPNVARGYWQREAESAAIFGARIADGGEGQFLRTGDLGFALDGELYVTGRITEEIVLGDRAFYPTDVERVCEEATPGLRHNGGAAFTIEVEGNLRLAIAFEIRDPEGDDHDELIESIREAIAEALGLELALVALLRPRTLPKTTSGKTRRGHCRGLLLNGELPTVAEWRASEA
jgi:acyl-CoA synthetase (AMP-forming)/AMP-acid ligase II